MQTYKYREKWKDDGRRYPNYLTDTRTLSGKRLVRCFQGTSSRMQPAAEGSRLYGCLQPRPQGIQSINLVKSIGK